METDRAYFQRRAAEEQRAAEQAASPQAREAHLELAARYTDMIAAFPKYLSAVA